MFGDAKASDFDVLRGRRALVHTGVFSTDTVTELRRYFDNNIRNNNNTSSSYVYILDGFLMRNQDPYAESVARNALGSIEGDYMENVTEKGVEVESAQARALRVTDVQYLQDSSENTGAVFMIASNFNALEGGRGFFENRLENMQYTPVQGENAALTTMGASLKRKYVFHTSYTQNAPHAGNVNLLQNLENNGVLRINVNGNVTRLNQSVHTNMIGDVAVGVHHNVVPTAGFYYPYSRKNSPGFHEVDTSAQKRIQFLENMQYLKKDRDPLYIYNAMTPIQFLSQHHIHQVFTAALNVKNYQTYTSNKEHAETTAQNILHAAYEGTLLEAARIADQEGTRKKVYLTLIGAGAFGNKLEWIADVFKNNTYIHEALRYANIDVYLIIYAGDAPDHASSRYDVIRDAVKELNTTISMDDIPKISMRLYQYVNYLQHKLNTLD